MVTGMGLRNHTAHYGFLDKETEGPRCQNAQDHTESPWQGGALPGFF